VRAGRGRSGLALLALTGLVALTGCTSPDTGAAVSAPAPLPKHGWHGTTIAEPYTKPDITLTDTSGHKFRFAKDAKRPVVLVAFGYTHCPWVCTRVLSDVATALKPLDPSTRGRIQVLFVTVDPDRDTPGRLAAWLQRFDPTFVGLTAPLSVVRSLGQDLGVPVTGRTSKAADYTVMHGAQVVGFGPDGTAHLIWMPGTAPGDLRADVVRLASTA
jgi:protein SCO1